MFDITFQSCKFSVVMMSIYTQHVLAYTQRNNNENNEPRWQICLYLVIMSVWYITGKSSLHNKIPSSYPSITFGNGFKDVMYTCIYSMEVKKSTEYFENIYRSAGRA